MLKTLLVPLLVVSLMYVLYIEGFGTVNAKSAVLFVGGRRGKEARFSSCNGYTKRVLRFREGREYRVCFDCALTAGEVSMEIREHGKTPLVTLGSGTGSASFLAERRKRYYLVISFKSASGDYRISIE